MVTIFEKSERYSHYKCFCSIFRAEEKKGQSKRHNVSGNCSFLTVVTKVASVTLKPVSLAQKVTCLFFDCVATGSNPTETCRSFVHDRLLKFPSVGWEENPSTLGCLHLNLPTSTKVDDGFFFGAEDVHTRQHLMHHNRSRSLTSHPTTTENDGVEGVFVKSYQWPTSVALGRVQTFKHVPTPIRWATKGISAGKDWGPCLIPTSENYWTLIMKVKEVPWRPHKRRKEDEEEEERGYSYKIKRQRI